MKCDVILIKTQRKDMQPLYFCSFRMFFCINPTDLCALSIPKP